MVFLLQIIILVVGENVLRIPNIKYLNGACVCGRERCFIRIDVLKLENLLFDYYSTYHIYLHYICFMKQYLFIKYTFCFNAESKLLRHATPHIFESNIEFKKDLFFCHHCLKKKFRPSLAT